MIRAAQCGKEKSNAVAFMQPQNKFTAQGQPTIRTVDPCLASKLLAGGAVKAGIERNEKGTSRRYRLCPFLYDGSLAL